MASFFRNCVLSTASSQQTSLISLSQSMKHLAHTLNYYMVLNDSCIQCLAQDVTHPLNHCHLFHMSLLICPPSLLSHSHLHQVTQLNQPPCREWLQLSSLSLFTHSIVPKLLKNNQFVSGSWIGKSSFLLTHHLPLLPPMAYILIVNN